MEEISSLVYKISAIAAFALLITGLCYFITYKKKSERIRKQEREISQAKDKLQQQAIENLQKERKTIFTTSRLFTQISGYQHSISK